MDGNIIPQEGIQWAAFISSLLGIIILGLKLLVPIIVKRFGKKQVVESKRDEHTLNVQKREDKLTFEAKEFLTDLARDNIQNVKTQAEQASKEVVDLKDELKKVSDKYHHQSIELAKLQATDELKKVETDFLRAEQKRLSVLVNISKDALQGVLSEVEENRKEKEALYAKTTILEDRVTKNEERIRLLEKELESVKAESTIKQGLLDAANNKIELLNTREENIKVKLGEYIERLRQHNLLQPEEAKKELLRTEEFFALQTDNIELVNEKEKPLDLNKTRDLEEDALKKASEKAKERFEKELEGKSEEKKKKSDDKLSNEIEEK